MSLATSGIGPAVVGLAISTAGALATLRLAQAMQRVRPHFKGEFDGLMRFAFDLMEGVAHIHTSLEGVSTQVNYIACLLHEEWPYQVFLFWSTMLLNALDMKCNDSHVTLSSCRVCEIYTKYRRTQADSTNVLTQ